MKPRKTKSGKWNVSVCVGMGADGKRIWKSVTKKTKAECIQAANELSVNPKRIIRVEEAVRRYLEAKEAVLSPTTHRGYLSIYNNHIKYDVFGFLPIDYLTDSHIQRWVSRLAATESAKTVRNVYGLVSAALRFADRRLVFNVKLPQKKVHKLHTPSTAEVQKVLAICKEWDEALYRAVLLAAVGMMRLGEICALTADDIDRQKNTITINKSAAITSKNELVVKPPKNDTSNRTIVLPEFVIDQLPEEGQIIGKSPNAISVQFRKLMERNKDKVTPFRFHDLRHYAASIAASSSIGASVESIKARGGWATDGMMKRVYINQIGEEVDKDTKAIIRYFEEHF